MSREQLMRADVAIPDWLIEDLLVEDNLGVIKTKKLNRWAVSNILPVAKGLTGIFDLWMCGNHVHIGDTGVAPHDHLPHLYTSVIFLTDSFGELVMTFPDSEELTITPEVGKMVLFPASWIHYVKPSPSPEFRVTFVSNYEFKKYKECQRIYNNLVKDHPDDFKNMEFVEKEELVENALHYFKEATFPLIYPAKSYAVAIIYAYKLNEIYGIDKYLVLNDPDLFLGQDPYFVPYSDNPKVYDEIMTRLEDMPNWIESGWAPQTVEYCLLECTEEGIDSITGGIYGISDTMGN